jgi:hypothetical protein
MIHKILCKLGFHHWGSWKVKDLWSRRSGIMGRNCIVCNAGFVPGHDYEAMKAMEGLNCQMYFDFEPQQLRDWFNKKFYDEKDSEWEK